MSNALFDSRDPKVATALALRGLDENEKIRRAKSALGIRAFHLIDRHVCTRCGLSEIEIVVDIRGSDPLYWQLCKQRSSHPEPYIC